MRQNDKFYSPSRRLVLAGLLTSGASVALAGAPKRSIRPKARGARAPQVTTGKAREIIARARLDGKVGYVVADADSGEILETHNPALTFPPASVTKTVTTLYGLDALGGAFRFATRVMATGAVVNGQVQGDLYLVGGGDPTLDSDALGDLVRQIKAAGVIGISGKTYVVANALPYKGAIDPAQPVYLGYNPAISGLNLNFNRVYFQWKRQKGQYETTMDARALKFRPRVRVASISVVDRRSPVFALDTYERREAWTVAKSALGRRGGRWLPVRRPEFYAAEVFQTIARSFGIALPDFSAASAVPDGTVLARWQSRELTEVLRRMLKYSTNLTAEAVGLTASSRRAGKPASLRASARLMTAWANSVTGTKHAYFVDHSGLGEANRISANDMVHLLKHEGWDGPLRPLLKEIPFHDAKGRKMKKSPVLVEAKTGTLNFVSALAGYAEGRHRRGRKLVFAIFAADLPRRAEIPKSQMERPKGERAWNHRAKKMQQELIAHWAKAFER